MGKNIIRVTSNRKEAQREAKRINISFKNRNIKREAYVGIVSQSYVRRLTRKGFPIAKKNYAIYVRNKG
jgi:hypothetical protein